MKMNKFVVTFESVLTIKVMAPEGTSSAEIRRVADEIASDLRAGGAWDPPDYVAIVGSTGVVEVPDEHLRLEKPNKYGYAPPVPGAMSDDQTLVLSDEKDDIVLPEDATWWLSAPSGV
jgi:hypothetical protein